MRPQQNRRMRGRGSSGGNRKGPNPLTRSYESNGPDVKIRGSAQQIAEKYATLARDAQSAGDRVMAENYLQHAEHYNRIIMAAQAQVPQQQMRDRNDDDDLDEGSEDTFTPAAADRSSQNQSQGVNGSGPQPVIEGTPAEVVLKRDLPVEAAPESGSAQPAEAESASQPRSGQADGQGTEAEEAPRRPRRPRRPRAKAAASGDEASDSDEPVTEAAQ